MPCYTACQWYFISTIAHHLWIFYFAKRPVLVFWLTFLHELSGPAMIDSTSYHTDNSTVLELRWFESCLSHRFLLSFIVFNQEGFPFLVFLNITYILLHRQLSPKQFTAILVWNQQCCMYEWLCMKIICIFCDDLCVCGSAFAVVVLASFPAPNSLQGKADNHQLSSIFLYIITAFLMIATSYLLLIKVLSYPNDQSPAFTTA